MLYVFLPPQWLRDQAPEVNTPKQMDVGDFKTLNDKGYGVYFYPNDASVVNNHRKFLDGADIDTFRWVFVDMDLKSKVYDSKEDFLEFLNVFPLKPNMVIDSGRGVHAYWYVTDLDAMSFLRLQRRLARELDTDEAVSKIKQVMRVPGTLNTKDPDPSKWIPCQVIETNDISYSAEQIDGALPAISPEDEAYCQAHWNKTYQVKSDVKINDVIPTKFKKLLKANNEVQKIWSGQVEDRSTADYRLGHIMLAANFTKDEAMSVLVNASKALERAPVHRVNYARDIVDKVWAYEEEEDFDPDDLSQSVQQILDANKGKVQGQRITCYSWIDNTKVGYRLGHVVGLVAGVKTGKTVLSLNMAKGFVASNPDMVHFFVALEQPGEEIAYLWRRLNPEEPHLWGKLRVISNYNKDGTHRQLSLQDIEEYIVKYQAKTGRKVGCVIVDHIGALKMEGYDRFKPIEDICHHMKPFAIRTNTLLVMQSHAPREKAGGGDLELNQDAAYGTQRFEAYVDWLITMWQPLKKAYGNKACPKVTAFKFAAIRHKEEGDVIQENERYCMAFMTSTGGLREMTQNEETQFDYFNKVCVNKRKQDRKTEMLTYTSVKTNGQADTSSKNPPAA